MLTIGRMFWDDGRPLPWVSFPTVTTVRRLVTAVRTGSRWLAAWRVHYVMAIARRLERR